MRSAHDLLVAAHDQLLQTLAVLQAASPAKATATVTTATSPLIRLSALDDSIHSNIDNSSNQAGTATSPTVTVATAAAATACDVAQEMQQLQQLSSTGSTKPPTIEALRAMVEEVRSKRRWVRETLRQVRLKATRGTLSMHGIQTDAPPPHSPLLSTTGTRAVRRSPRSLRFLLAEQHSCIIHPTTQRPLNHTHTHKLLAYPTAFPSIAVDLSR